MYLFMGKKKRNPSNWITVFFFPQFCEVGDHRQEDLAKFGYRSGSKVEKVLESYYILATC
jgi:hypothetical protein